MATPERKRKILNEDGELREALEAAHADAEPIYCTRCGTPNPADSRYCRKCGRSLEEQEAEMMGIPGRDALKAKNEARMARLAVGDEQAGRSAALVQIWTMILVAAMTIVSISTPFAQAAVVPILLAWFLVEGIRNGYRTRMTPYLARVNILTTLFVTVITIVAVSTPFAVAATVPIMLIWFLIEGIRGNM